MCNQTTTRTSLSLTVHDALQNAMAERTTVSRLINPDSQSLNIDKTLDGEGQPSTNAALVLQLPTSSVNQPLPSPFDGMLTRMPEMPFVVTAPPQPSFTSSVEQSHSQTQHRLSIENLIHSSRDPTSALLPAQVVPALLSKTTNTSTPTPMKLILNGGLEFVYNSNNVPAPMALRLANMDTLAQWWDDSSSEWNPRTAPYKIKGQAIALKYWREIYHRDPRWESTKNQWHLWKVSLSLLQTSECLQNTDQSLVYYGILPETYFN